MEFRHWNEETEEGYDDFINLDDRLDIQIGFTGSEEHVKVSIGDDADEFGLGIFATFSKQAPDQTILNAFIEVSGEDAAMELLATAGMSEIEAKKKIARSNEHTQ